MSEPEAQVVTIDAGLLADLLAQSRDLVGKVNFDDHGTMVAGQLVGGNGGLISRETLIACDTLSKTLNDFESE